jgi:hypothetical protein
MFKLIRRLFSVALLLVVLIVVGFFSIDSLAEGAIEKAGTYALGVETTLDDADVGVLTGNFELEGLRVRNPAGFSQSYLLEIRHGEAKLDFGSIFKGRLDIPELELSGVDLRLENKGSGTNYGVILENLKRFETKGEKKEGKRFIIRELVVKDVTCHVDLVPVLGSITPPLTIPELRLANIGAKDGQGLVLSELAAVVIEALFHAVAQKGAGILPAQLTGDLGSQLGELFRSGGKGVSGLEDVFKSIENIGGIFDGKKK